MAGLEDDFHMDVFVDIEYDVNEGNAVVSSNARDVDSFLSEYVHGITGDGKTDERKAVERDTYKIRIEGDLSFDKFRVSADTGNTSLTTGIIARTIGNWKKK